jgi:hypothetical protein
MLEGYLQEVYRLLMLQDTFIYKAHLGSPMPHDAT